MAVPKRRTTRSKRNMRRSHHKAVISSFITKNSLSKLRHFYTYDELKKL